jgi:tight adherence protein C
MLYSLLAMPVYFFLLARTAGSVGGGVTAAVLLSGLTFWWLRHRLTRLARQRLVTIKRRMPFLLDLLTLLMQAGATFLQALKQSVKEFEGHAVAVEFGRVLTDMNVGKTRAEAFENLRTRLKDDEIGGIVAAIVQGEQLGTPMAEVFRTQADVLRLKRSQRAEAIAGEAGVNMLLPGILVMAACVLVILGPFVLGSIASGFF